MLTRIMRHAGIAWDPYSASVLYITPLLSSLCLFCLFLLLLFTFAVNFVHTSALPCFKQQSSFHYPKTAQHPAWPVVLTLVIIKCFQGIILDDPKATSPLYIWSAPVCTLAHHTHRGLSLYCSTNSHLESKDTYLQSLIQCFLFSCTVYICCSCSMVIMMSYTLKGILPVDA